VVPLLLAPSNPLAVSATETTEFSKSCEEAGVRLMERPSAPVRSIAYDWNPQHLTTRPYVDRIETDSTGRILASGLGKPNSSEAQKKLAFEFTESRRDFIRSGPATVNPNAPYYHFPDFSTNQPYYGVQSLSADVLAFLDVDKPEELRKAPAQQGAMRYKLTLTDRRSGTVLGVHTYVVDLVNKRACGANVDNTISQSAFIYDAIHR
jgi:hypothetical protein